MYNQESAPMYRTLRHWVSSSYDRTSLGARQYHLLVRERMGQSASGKPQVFAETACGLSIRGGRTGKSFRITTDPTGRICENCRAR